MVTSGELTVGPNLTKTACSLDSFAFIARISVKPYGLVVRANSPWKNFGELRRQVLEQPGKLSIGTAPPVTNLVQAELFRESGNFSP